MSEERRNGGNGDGVPARDADRDRETDESLDEMIARAGDPATIRRRRQEAEEGLDDGASAAEDAGGLTEESYTAEQMADEIAAYHLEDDGTGEGAEEPWRPGIPPVRYRPSARVGMTVWGRGEKVPPPAEVESAEAAAEPSAEASDAPAAAANGAAREGPGTPVEEGADAAEKEFFRQIAESAAGAPDGGSANGSAAAGNPPGRADGAPLARIERTAEDLSLAEFLVALDHKIEVLGNVNRNTHDDVVKAVRQGVQEIKAVSPSMETPHIAALVTALGELKEFVRVSETDGLRRREIRELRWKWPLLGLAGVFALALVLGGAVIQARWGVVEDPLNEWKQIVWDSHGMPIAECIDRAERRGGDARCRVSLEVR